MSATLQTPATFLTVKQLLDPTIRYSYVLCLAKHAPRRNGLGGRRLPTIALSGLPHIERQRLEPQPLPKLRAQILRWMLLPCSGYCSNFGDNTRPS